MNTREIWLAIEPKETAGMTIRLFQSDALVREISVEPKADPIAAVDACVKNAHIDGVFVRSHTGSFSASRAALVIAEVLSATRAAPLIVTELPLATPAEILAAHIAKSTAFSYAAPPHITTPA